MLSKEIKGCLPKICAYLATTPVVRAWIFGSCSRGEEHEGSDIDLMVNYDKGAKVTLLTIGGIMADIEDLTGRRADVVEEEGLRSFAVPSAVKDRILIYERKHTGLGEA